MGYGRIIRQACERPRSHRGEASSQGVTWRGGQRNPVSVKEIFENVESIILLRRPDLRGTSTAQDVCHYW